MSKKVSSDIKALLDEAYERYARPEFIENDPLQIPRSFSDRPNAEVIGFITATIAWGQRKTIISNAWKLVELMDRAPHSFVMNATEQDLDRLDRFVHRTFNGVDRGMYSRVTPCVCALWKFGRSISTRTTQ